MTETNVTRTVSNQNVGGTVVQQEKVTSAEYVDKEEFTLAKLGQFVWFVTHFIATVLVLRFIFLLLGANMTGIVRLIYDLSSVFILPFRGIFPSPRTGEMYFDTSTLLAIVFYYLFAYLIIRILMLFSKSTEV